MSDRHSAGRNANPAGPPQPIELPEAGRITVYRCRKCKKLTTEHTHCFVKGPPLIPQLDDYSLCDPVEAVVLSSLTPSDLEQLTRGLHERKSQTNESPGSSTAQEPETERR